MGKMHFGKFYSDFLRNENAVVSLLDTGMDDHAPRVAVLVPGVAWGMRTESRYCKVLEDWPQLAGAVVIGILAQSDYSCQTYGPAVRVVAELPLADLEVLAAAIECGELMGTVSR